MVAATADERANPALRSKTRQAVQVIDCQIADQIEFWKKKKPSKKDLSGWRGPSHHRQRQA
eukprot:2742982-Prorocentrum_lima.AAC.1